MPLFPARRHIRQDCRYHEQGAAVRLGAEVQAAVNLFSTFGYFEADSEELETLSNLCVSLKPGGRLIMDLLGKEVIARTFRPRDWHENAERNLYLLEERRVRGGWEHIDNRWLLLDASGIREFRWTIRLYSGKELDRLLRQAGFTQVTLHGDLSGAPYNDEARRLVIVAVK